MTGQWWINRLRSLLAAETDLIVDETDGAEDFWTLDDLIHYFNAGFEEFCHRRPIHDTTSSVTSVVVPTTGSISLDSSILWVEQVIAGNRQLARTTELELDAAFPGYPGDPSPWRSKSGDATHWHPTTGTPMALRLYPLPAAETTASLTVKRLPLEPLTSGNVNEELADPLSSRDGQAVLLWAASLAFDRDDSETYNPNKSAVLANKFDAQVGHRKDPADVEFMQRVSGSPPTRTRAYYR